MANHYNQPTHANAQGNQLETNPQSAYSSTVPNTMIHYSSYSPFQLNETPFHPGYCANPSTVYPWYGPRRSEQERPNHQYATHTHSNGDKQRLPVDKERYKTATYPDFGRD